MSEEADGPANRWTLIARVLLVLGLVAVVGFLAWVAVESCATEGGCYDGARTMWRENVPEEIRKHLRGALVLVFTPVLWIAVVLVFVAEKVWPAKKNQKVFNNSLVYDFAAWFVLDKFGFGLLFALLFGYSWVQEWWADHMAWATLDLTPHLPTWALLVASFVFADFLNWLHHLIRHKVPVLWMFHAVHHSPQEMNVFTDDRVHPVEKLVSAGIMLFPQLILKIEVEWVAWMLVFQTTYTHIYHGNIRTDYGPLRWIFVTPQSHRIHHSAEKQHRDTNYGVIFSIWDRIFRTHVDDTGYYADTGVYDTRFPLETSWTPEHVLGRYFVHMLYPFYNIYLRLTTGRWYPTPNGAYDDDSPEQAGRAEPAPAAAD